MLFLVRSIIAIRENSSATSLDFIKLAFSVRVSVESISTLLVANPVIGTPDSH
jgi:hypothetical protein